jgi:hypothetical protein
MLVRFEQLGKLAMLLDHVKRPHFLRDEVVDVEEHTILVLVHIPEANGTLEPTLDFGKSNGVVVVTTSSWPGLLVFLVIVVFLRRDRFNLSLILGRLLDHLLLGRFLPHESSKPCHQGFVVLDFILKLFFQFLNPRHENLNIYEWLYLVIKMEISKNRSMT